MPLIRQKRSGNITKSGAITALPKNQIKEIDSLQGTLPIDLSINGHELINTDIKFDDSKNNYVFGSLYEFGNISEGVPKDSNYYGSIISSPNTVGTSFSKEGVVTKEFLKDSRQRDRLEVSYKAYKEENQVSIDQNNVFYVSGTSPFISNNFQQSINSREKIELDFMGVAIPTSPFGAISYLNTKANGDVSINTFSYYDFNDSTWTKFKGFQTNTNDREGTSEPDFVVNKKFLSDNLENLALPFSPCSWTKDKAGSANSSLIKGAVSEPISNFGFPFSNKYEPFEKNKLKLLNYINKPFYLEKIILKCNIRYFAHLQRDPTVSQVMPFPFSVCTNFFLLNNKKINSKRKINNINNDTVNTLNSDETISNYCGDNNQNYFRELITYAKIISTTTGSMQLPDSFSTESTYDLNKLEKQADFFKYSGNHPGSSFSLSTSHGEIKLDEEEIEVQIEVPVRQSIKNQYISFLHTSHNDLNIKQSFVGNELGSRSLLGKDLNRSFVNNSENYSSIIENYTSGLGLSPPVYNILDNDNREVPYILYPEDEITIGFSTFSNLWIDNESEIYSYITGPAKLVLVGTPINDDRPKFEFDKRFLTSKNIRSGIIGDKHFTDFFDTLPIQLYASSSIDKIIANTGNRIIDREVSGYYSGGNRGTLLKAVEIKNSDIILSGSSIAEKMHFNYNKYGNFSDIYAQRKYTSYYKQGENVVSFPVEKIFYDQQEGNVLSQENTLSFNSDFNSKITTPFEDA